MCMEASRQSHCRSVMINRMVTSLHQDMFSDPSHGQSDIRATEEELSLKGGATIALVCLHPGRPKSISHGSPLRACHLISRIQLCRPESLS